MIRWFVSTFFPKTLEAIVSAKYQELLATVAALESENGRVKQTVEALAGEINAVRDDLATAVDARNASQAQVATLTQQVADLEALLAAAGEGVTDAELDAVKARVAAVAQALSDLATSYAV